MLKSAFPPGTLVDLPASLGGRQGASNCEPFSGGEKRTTGGLKGGSPLFRAESRSDVG
jgi:hypothetical protein